MSPITGAAVGAAIGGLTGAVWADNNNDGYADGYVQNGQYYQGTPSGYDSTLGRVATGAGVGAVAGAAAGALIPGVSLLEGVTGSGKSTAALAIGARTGHPVTLVDELSWQPGWVPVPEAEQREVFGTIAAGERWLLDSSYGQWLDLVLPRTQLVVGLDYPRWLSLSRLVRRTVSGAMTKAPLGGGKNRPQPDGPGQAGDQALDGDRRPRDPRRLRRRGRQRARLQAA